MRRRRCLIILMSMGILAGITLVVWRLSAPAPCYRVTVFATITGKAIHPCSLNDRGQVVGRCQSQPSPADMPREPCYWNPTDATAAAGRRLPDRACADMNNRGYVVGTHYFSDFKPYVVLWRDYAGLKKLFPHDPGDNPFGGAFLVNDANQVICSQVHDSRWGRFSRRLFPVRIRYFLWDPQHGKIPLDRYVSGLGSFEVRDLNNRGCILGVVRAKDGSSTAVLLEPIAERWKR
jgi:hypothetical protein